MPLGTDNQPAGDRHADHQCVQGKVHQGCQQALPRRRRRYDLWRYPQAAREQAQPHQHKHGEAEHEVHLDDQRSCTAAFGKLSA